MIWVWLCAAILMEPWIPGIRISKGIDVTNVDKSWCPTTCSCPLLYRADCRNNNYRTLRADTFTDNSNKLRALWLDKSKINSLEDNVFQKIQNLTRLSIAQNFLESINSAVFRNLFKLTHLDLSGNSLKSPLDANVFTSLVKLNELNLASNKLTTVDVQLFEPFQCITKLILADNPFICDCKIRSAIEWTQNENLETDGFCRCPRPGSSWRNFDTSRCVTYMEDDCSDKNTNETDILTINDDSSTTFSPTVILLITFGIVLMLIILGLVTLCLKKKFVRKTAKGIEMKIYDDVKPNDYYYYETVGRLDMRYSKHVSVFSSGRTPELPKRPKIKETDVESIKSDEENNENDNSRFPSYIEPIGDELKKEETKSSTAVKPKLNNPNIGDLENSRYSQLTNPGIPRNKTVLPENSKLVNSAEIGTIYEEKDFPWNRESFWKI